MGTIRKTRFLDFVVVTITVLTIRFPASDILISNQLQIYRNSQPNPKYTAKICRQTRISTNGIPIKIQPLRYHTTEKKIARWKPKVAEIIIKTFSVVNHIN
ncbi:MAG: hypothetical protein LBJ00_13375 [Planctomycetaceae bacterium]|nr:hypothetical protein [Planctomycetaceae bacterium]